MHVGLQPPVLPPHLRRMGYRGPVPERQLLRVALLRLHSYLQLSARHQLVPARQHLPLELDRNWFLERHRHLHQALRNALQVPRAVLRRRPLHVGRHRQHLPHRLPAVQQHPGVHQRQHVRHRHQRLHRQVRPPLPRRGSLRRRRRVPVGLGPRQVQPCLQQVRLHLDLQRRPDLHVERGLLPPAVPLSLDHGELVQY